MDDDDDGFYSKLLQCNVLKIEFFDDGKTVEIFFPPDHCCDMTGCIKFVKKICPNILMIKTTAERKRDSVYKFNKEKDVWEAFTWYMSDYREE
jgi:hypothetical protein